MSPDPEAHIARARALCNGASVSLEHVMAALESRSFVVRVEQQADWIIGELEHAVSQIRQAQEDAFLPEPRAAESYVPARAA